MENNLNDAFQITLFDDSIKSLSQDYLELGIDSLMDNELIKSIPIIKTLNALYKTTKSIEEYRLKRKIIRFLFQIKDIPKDQISKTLKKIEDDTSYKKDFVENLILILDKFDDINKAELLGKAFKIYLKEEISTEDFLRASHIIDKSFYNDLLKLIKIKNKIKIEKISYENLISLGLLTIRPHDVRPGMTGLDLRRELNIADYLINSAGELIIKVLETL
jgi:hypothetical protein